MRFLPTVSTIKEGTFDYTYGSLCLSVMDFRLLIQRCESYAGKNRDILQPTESKMLGKLDQYRSCAICRFATLAKILDPNFENNVLSMISCFVGMLQHNPVLKEKMRLAPVKIILLKVLRVVHVWLMSLLSLLLKQERGSFGGPYDGIVRLISTT